jgi:hypothetical protein
MGRLNLAIAFVAVILCAFASRTRLCVKKVKKHDYRNEAGRAGATD